MTIAASAALSGVCMITNDHPELLRARAILEANRTVTKWQSTRDNSPACSSSGAPFCEVVSGGFLVGDARIAELHRVVLYEAVHIETPAIKYSATAAEAVASWLESALAYASGKPFIQWRVEPEIEECPEGWAIYSRFVAFREGQRPVWPDVLATRDVA